MTYIKNIQLFTDNLTSDDHKIKENVNKASSEIMLHRIYDGHKWEFPFSNFLNIC